MVQKTPPIIHLPTAVQPGEAEQPIIVIADLRTLWVARITRVVGAVFLIIALTVWAARPGHHRLVLALLTIAMFAAILHSYTFENGG